MKLLNKLIVSILFISLVSCTTTVPSVKFQGYTPSRGKYDIKAALVTPKEFKNYVYYFTIFGSCNYPSTIGERRSNAKIKAGIAAEELVIKGLPIVFKKVDIYGDASEIKREENYDFILIPTISVEMKYDSDKAQKRKLKDVLEISTIIKLGLKVRDFQTDKRGRDRNRDLRRGWRCHEYLDRRGD